MTKDPQDRSENALVPIERERKLVVITGSTVVRPALAAGFAVAGGLLAWAGQFFASNADLLLNLGTEIVGIAITVGIVDALRARRERREKVQRISTAVRDAVGYVTWVWLGGSRSPSTPELIGVLHEVIRSEFKGIEATLSVELERGLMKVGSRSRNTLVNDKEATLSEPGLRRALQLLVPLERVRETGFQKTNPELVLMLLEAVRYLTVAAGEDADAKALPPSWKRDFSRWAQVARDVGEPAARERFGSRVEYAQEGGSGD